MGTRGRLCRVLLLVATRTPPECECWFNEKAVGASLPRVLLVPQLFWLSQLAEGPGAHAEPLGSEPAVLLHTLGRLDFCSGP